ncbi:hypothetical protein E2C01_005664 [Portunus trituberculatus]|uniref:Uncharacterized protein n=1 Tax=Portunus trituberculatus TaxID=210409 RepID=A0A5B7CSZ6_PORTR|nr:hypothetical protein [Portunus trituberculatus]
MLGVKKVDPERRIRLVEGIGGGGHPEARRRKKDSCCFPPAGHPVRTSLYPPTSLGRGGGVELVRGTVEGAQDPKNSCATWVGITTRTAAVTSAERSQRVGGRNDAVGTRRGAPDSASPATSVHPRFSPRYHSIYLSS